VRQVLITRQVRRLAGLLAVAGALLVLYTTLFPFDFHTDEPQPFFQASAQFDFQPLRYDSDWMRNVVLFLPLGYGILCLLGTATNTSSAHLAALTLCLGLSISVELLQHALPARQSELTDIIANGGGALAASLLYAGWRDQPLKNIAERLTQFKRSISLQIGVVAYVGYLILLLTLVGHLLVAPRLDAWDRSYALALGNEVTGDRPWHGTLTHLLLYSHALTASEVARLLSTPAAVPDYAPVASYQITANDPIPSTTNLSPALSWQKAGGEPVGQFDGSFNAQHWLLSVAPATTLVDQIANSSHFSLVASVSAAKRDQDGPARIIALSAGPMVSNLTIGQLGDDLVLRLRTRSSGVNGLFPELLVPDLFATTEARTLVITYNQQVLRVYIDSPDHPAELEFRPELAFFAYLRPVDQWFIRLGRSPLWIFSAIYGVMLLLPIGAISVLAATTVRAKTWLRLALSGGGALLPPLMMMIIYGEYGWSSSWRDLSLFIASSSLTLLWYWWVRPWVANPIAPVSIQQPAKIVIES
jgi:VanZ family protein